MPPAAIGHEGATSRTGGVARYTSEGDLPPAPRATQPPHHDAAETGLGTVPGWGDTESADGHGASASDAAGARPARGRDTRASTSRLAVRPVLTSGRLAGSVERGAVLGEDTGAEIALRIAPHPVHVVDLALGVRNPAVRRTASRCSGAVPAFSTAVRCTDCVCPDRRGSVNRPHQISGSGSSRSPSRTRGRLPLTIGESIRPARPSTSGRDRLRGRPRDPR